MADLNRKYRLRPVLVGNATIENRGASEPSAVIQIEDKNGGFLTARLTTAERDAIIDPADGLMVWNTDTTQMEVFALGTGGWGASGGGGGGGAVNTVFGRSGNVIAAASDYDADQVDFTPAAGLVATDLQAALVEVQGNIGSISIDDLTDVDTTSTAPTPGDIITWDGSNWTPTNPSDNSKQNVAADIAARNAITGQAIGDQAYVVDASADGSVTAGAALYVWDGAVWQKIAEFESLDLADFGGANGVLDGTAGLVPQPNANDDGKFLRGDGDWEDVGKNRAFADELTVNPTVPGSPTVIEMTAFVGLTTITDQLVFYTGTNTNTDAPTHVYWVDQAGTVTEIQSPAAGDMQLITEAAATFSVGSIPNSVVQSTFAGAITATVDHPAAATGVVYVTPTNVLGVITFTGGTSSVVGDLTVRFGEIAQITYHSGSRAVVSKLNGPVDTLSDGDGDTVILVEETADNDTIAMRVGDASGNYDVAGNDLITLEASAITIQAPFSAVGSATAGADILMAAGDGDGVGNGGTVDISAGVGGTAALGGSVSIVSGSGPTSGAASIGSAISTSGNSGALSLSTGFATGGVSGALTISTANGTLGAAPITITAGETQGGTDTGAVSIHGAGSGAGGGDLTLRGGNSAATPGAVIIGGRTTATGGTTELRFASEASTSNFVAFKAPDAMAADVVWTLPDADATVDGQSLISDASGALSWGYGGPARLFADDATVNPGSNGGSAGAPSLAEIQTFVTADGAVQTLVYYTGSDTSTDTPTYLYWVDGLGVVTQIELPAGALVDGDGDTFVSVEQAADSDTIIMQVAGGLTHTTDTVINMTAATSNFIGLDGISGNNGGRFTFIGGTGNGAGSGGGVSFTAGNGGTSGSGGNIAIVSGSTTDATRNTGVIQIATSGSATALNSGEITLDTGDMTVGSAGAIRITPGATGGANTGATVFVTGGDSDTGTAGNVQIRGGASSSGDTGSVTLTTSASTGTGQTSGSVNIQTGNGDSDANAGSIRFNIGRITGSGTPGSILIGNSNTIAGQTTELRFEELSANGSQYVAFKAPDTIAANTVWALPAEDGDDKDVLTTDGSGNLSFEKTSATETFNATTDWGTAAGGFYTLTVAAATHEITAPVDARVWENEAGDFVLVQPDRLAITAADDVTVRVTEVPDGRFAGRVVIS